MNYTKERKYNYITDQSRHKGGSSNNGATKFIEAYKGMTHAERVKTSALNASDNGRCWWIHDYIIRRNLSMPKEV